MNCEQKYSVCGECLTVVNSIRECVGFVFKVLQTRLLALVIVKYS